MTSNSYIFQRLSVPAFLLITIIFISCENSGSRTDAFRLHHHRFPVLRASDSLPLIVRRLDTLFRTKTEKGFNGNVLIARRGKVLYRKSFGWKDHRKKDPLLITDHFQIASTTKTFTSVALLKLYASGRLRLDDRVEKYIPGFPYKGITIRMLLSHRSGLPEYHYFSEDHFTDHDRPVSTDTMIALLCRAAPGLYHKPGKKFDYCNTNFILLAKIIERVSGKSYSRFLEEEVFIPLGMMETWVRDPAKKNDREILCGYDTKWRVKKDNFLDGCAGDKGIYSTVNDLFLFDQALYGDNLLPDSLKELAFSPHSKEFRGAYNYGLGWRILRNGGPKPVVYHNGWWHGFNSCFYRRLEDSTTVIMLGNKFSRETYRIYGILGILDNQQVAEDKEIGNEDAEKKEEQ